MLNILLIIAGLLLTATGIYRTSPVTINLKFMLQWGPLWTILAVMLIWVSLKLGPESLKKGALGAITNASNYMPLLVGLMFAMSYGRILVASYTPQILLSMSGSAGYWGALLAAFAAPSPASIAPIIRDLWVTKAMRPKLMLTLLSAPMLSWNLFFIRTMGLDWGIAGLMYVIGAGLSVSAAIILSIFH